jgi:hypothetical protein
MKLVFHAITSFGAKFVEGRFSHIGTFFSFIEFVLKFAVFGKVGVSLFFRFFGLAFVGLDFNLEFVDKVLDSRKVFLLLCLGFLSKPLIACRRKYY